LQDRGDALLAFGAARHLEGNARLRQCSLGADDALGDRRFGSEESAGDFLRREAAEQAQSEGKARFHRQDRVTGDEHQVEEIIANVVIDGGVDIDIAALGLDLIDDRVLFALMQAQFANTVDATMLGGGHQPGGGPFRQAILGPALECSEKCVLRQFLGNADIAGEARQPGNEPCLLDAPDRFDRAIGVRLRHASRLDGWHDRWQESA
jgi:hypothetical protein